MSFRILTLTLIIFVSFNLSKIWSEVRYVSHKNCNYVEKGTIVANPGNCSQYIICNGLRSTLGECPNGQYFNENMLSCDKNPLTCRENVLTSTTSTTLSYTDVEEKANENYTETITFIRPICYTSKTYNIAYPLNCFKYYECANGVLTLKRCPLGFAFHWIKRRCVSRANVICTSYGK